MGALEPFGDGPVSVTVEARVAVVTLERGDRLNALSVAAMEGLLAVAQRLREDVSTSAVVLTGKPVFSAGADLADPALAARAGASLIERREMMRIGPDLCAAWEALDQVTIAAVEGFCLGGALALAVACDFRVAGEGAHFRLPEIPLGMNMSWHAQPRLVNLIGPARTKRLVILGEKVSAAEALAWGLIEATAPDGGALEASLGWARRVAALPPLSTRMAKRSITQFATALNRLGTFMDADQYALAALSEDHREAVAAFFEKRAPRFTGR
ncbi:MAG TPA: enoyl-CoA hydratase/isomerase family protein [Caulobacteraceae bacterium]|nr:enoyl-CoA hydratase/isomerase family protein [Caulobacteraceae bacterium]